ncbi:MAG: alanine racemase [Bacteroidota bacterium]
MPQSDKGLPPVWAEVNFERLQHNLTVIYNRLKPGTKVMAVVKGNAYGHGSVMIATELARLGVDYFAVATVDEGVELRVSRIKGMILILEMIGPEQLDLVVNYELTPTVYSLEQAEMLAKKADQLKKTIKIHLRIDTGVGGIGASQQEIRQLFFKIRRSKSLIIEGVYTHLTSDYRGDNDSVQNQITMFNQILSEIKESGATVSLIHVASSLSVLTRPEIHFNMVRPGIALYGIPPVEGLEEVGLKPIMQLKTRISCIRKLEANQEIGTYHGKFIAVQPINYAIIPIGYADAFFLLTTVKGKVLIKGKRAPIIGQARMNHILVDVTMIPEAAVGDEVVIIGEQGEEAITAQEATQSAGIAAMNCESVCLFSNRVPRIYISEMDKGKTGEIGLLNEPAIAVGGVND